MASTPCRACRIRTHADCPFRLCTNHCRSLQFLEISTHKTQDLSCPIHKNPEKYRKLHRDEVTIITKILQDLYTDPIEEPEEINDEGDEGDDDNEGNLRTDEHDLLQPEEREAGIAPLPNESSTSDSARAQKEKAGSASKSTVLQRTMQALAQRAAESAHSAPRTHDLRVQLTDPSHWNYSPDAINSAHYLIHYNQEDLWSVTNITEMLLLLEESSNPTEQEAFKHIRKELTQLQRITALFPTFGSTAPKLLLAAASHQQRLCENLILKKNGYSQQQLQQKSISNVVEQFCDTKGLGKPDKTKSRAAPQPKSAQGPSHNTKAPSGMVFSRALQRYISNKHCFKCDKPFHRGNCTSTSTATTTTAASSAV